MLCIGYMYNLYIIHAACLWAARGRGPSGTVDDGGG